MRLNACLAASLLAALSPAATAQVITYTVEGTVSESVPTSAFWGGVQVGDSLTARVIVDAFAPGEVTSATGVRYLDSVLEIQVETGALQVSTPATSGLVFLGNDKPTTSGMVDEMLLGAVSASMPASPLEELLVALYEVRPFPAPFLSSNDLPTTGTYSAFTDADITVYLSDSSDNIVVDNVTYTAQISAANDDCADAVALSSGFGVTSFNATGATTDGADGAGFVDYGTFGDEQNYNDIWFTYTPSVNGCTYISTLGLVDWDSRLTVYQGTGCPDDPLNIIAAADDEVRVPALAAPFEAGLDVDLIAGQTYTIRLGTFDATTLPGAGAIRIEAGPGADINSGGMNPSAPGCSPLPSNDLCANATPIAGTGTFNFDLTAATLDGVLDSLCECESTKPSVGSDVWFSWAAPSTGLFTLSTVGLTGGQDTVLAVHEGCGGISINCNDDAVGAESELRFHAEAGSLYRIRVGSFAAATVMVGQFSILPGGTLPSIQTIASFDGRSYSLLSLSTWPDAQLAARQLGGRLVTVNNQAEHDFLVNTFQVPNLEIWIGLNDRANEGSFEWESGTVAAYRNFQPGEPNGQALGGEDYVHLASFFGGLWNDRPGCRIHNSVVEFESPFYSESCFGDGGDQSGCSDCPCNNNAPIGTLGGCLNSAGRSARLLPSGRPWVSDDTLHFDMTGGTSNAFAILSSGDAVAPANAVNPCFGLNTGIQSPTLDGLRCAVQGVQRHGTRPMDGNGDVGFTTNGWGPPNGPAGGIIAQGGFVVGQTRHFQVIYREEVSLGCGTGLGTSQVVSVLIDEGF